jgi:hypothetical protein
LQRVFGENDGNPGGDMVDYWQKEGDKDMKEVSEMSVPELFECFEKDILYDCHSLRAKVSRSQAGKEIERRKAELMPLVQQHIESKSGSQNEQVLSGWETLLNWMQDPAEVSA